MVPEIVVVAAEMAEVAGTEKYQQFFYIFFCISIEKMENCWTLPVVKFALVDIVVEHFAVAMAAAAVELVAGLELVVVDVLAIALDVHYRSDYPDVVSRTVAQLVNHLAAAVELKVVYQFD